MSKGPSKPEISAAFTIAPEVEAQTGQAFKQQARTRRFLASVISRGLSGIRSRDPDGTEERREPSTAEHDPARTYPAFRGTEIIEKYV
jgi:hypothetical protein